MGMRATRGELQLLAALLVLVPAALAQPAGSSDALDALRDAGRTGEGARVLIVGADPGPLETLVRDLAPDAIVTARVAPTASAAAEAAAAARDVDVLLLDAATLDPSSPDAAALRRASQDARAAGIAVVAPTGERALQHWRGAFADADGDRLLDLDARIVAPLAAPVRVQLAWSADAPADYDLYLYDAAFKTPLAWSVATSGTLESITLPSLPDGARVVVRAYDGAPPATLRIVVDGANLQGASAVGSITSPADAPGVASVGSASATAGLGPTDDGRVAPTFLDPSGAATSTSAARIAGLLALLAAERPDLDGDALVALAAAHGAWPDPLATLRAADVTPARVASAATTAPAAVAGGDVAITVTFDDALTTTRGALALVASDGARVPVGELVVRGASATGVARLPDTLAEGALRVTASTFVDWAGHLVESATLDIPVLVDRTPPALAWAALPTLAAGAVSIGWTAADASGLARVTLESAAADDPWATVHEGASPAWWVPAVEGATTLRLRATDAAGNVATLASAPIVVDLAPPSVVADGLRATIRDSGAGLDVPTLRITLDGDDATFTFDPATGALAIAADPAPGYHEVRLRVADLAGRIAAPTWGFEVAAPDMGVVYPLPDVGPRTADPLPPPEAPRAAPAVAEFPHEAAPVLAPPPASAPVAAPPVAAGPEPAPDAPAPPASSPEGAPLGYADGDAALLREDDASALGVAAPSAPAPAYDWQPPAMILALTALAALWLYAARARVRLVVRGIRLAGDRMWARLLRVRWRFIDVKGLPHRVALRFHATMQRLRWRFERARAR